MVRVGADANDQALGEPRVQPVEMRGRPVTGFVRVTPEGYRTDAALRVWIDRGLAFVDARPKNASQRKTRRAAPKSRRK